MKKRCTCGTESCEIPADVGGSLAKIAEASGFEFVWNVSNGLDAIWLCQPCMKLVRDAWEVITRVAGTDNVNLACVKRRTKK